MKDIQFKFKELLFAGILLLLLLPAIQHVFNLVEITPLKGSIEKVEPKKLTLDTWFSGDFQTDNEKFINDNFGFRNVFVRMNNEIAFRLYNKAKANGVIIGKNNYLYELNYLHSYNGTDFIGKDSIDQRMEKLKFIQDTLQKLNKTVLVVFAAGKGFYYPEYFPEEFKIKRSLTNYDYYLEKSKQLKINYIDFNDYFVNNKVKSKYPLYPQYGIHWSKYGMGLAADSMISYIENNRNIDMNNLTWKKVSLEDPKEEDFDIEDGMNLLCRLKSFKMGYPELHFEQDKQKTKPNVLMISDSFYWGMFNFGISCVFDKSHFWYYNKEVYPETFTSPLTTDKVNLKKEIQNHDVIIIMATPATLPNFGWGFIEKAYKEIRD